MGRFTMVADIRLLLAALHRQQHPGSRYGVDIGLAIDATRRGLVWAEWRSMDGVTTSRILGTACNERLPELLTALSAGEWPDITNWADEV